MDVARKLFAFYIDSSIHVAFSVSSLLIITCLEYDLVLQNELLILVFFGSISGYNFVKYAEVAGLHHRSLAKSLRAIQIFSFLCLIPLLYVVFQVPLKVLQWMVLFGILTVFYAVPFLNRRSLRTLSGVKIFVVAVVWAGITVIIPWVAVNEYFDADIGISFVQRILLVLVLLFPFEIRDLQYDQGLLATIPQKLGVLKTKLLGTVLIIFIVALDLFKDELTVGHFTSLLLMALFLLIMLWKSKEKQSTYFASFWVETLPILWLVLLYGFVYLDIS